jgi:hypothetical protein
VALAAGLLVSTSPALAQIEATAAGALVRMEHSPAAPETDSQVALLARLAVEAKSFRVRARAAVSLAHDGSHASLGALEQALEDPHSAVRVAAAASLASIGQRRSVAALRRASHDSSVAVADRAKLALRAIASRLGTDAEGVVMEAPARVSDASVRARLSRARHAIVLGEMKDRSGFADPELSHAMSEHAESVIDKLDQVIVLRESELDAELEKELGKRKVSMYRLEGNLQSVTVTNRASERHVRCEVTLLLLDEPGRTLRSMMRGAATGVALKQGAVTNQSRTLARTALRSAVRTALSSARAASEGVPESELTQSEPVTRLTRPERARAPAARLSSRSSRRLRPS